MSESEQQLWHVTYSSSQTFRFLTWCGFHHRKQSLEQPPKGWAGLPCIGGFQDTTRQGARWSHLDSLFRPRLDQIISGSFFQSDLSYGSMFYDNSNSGCQEIHSYRPFSKSIYFPLAYNQKFITFAIKVKKTPKIGFRLLLLGGNFQW